MYVYYYDIAGYHSRSSKSSLIHRFTPPLYIDIPPHPTPPCTAQRTLEQYGRRSKGGHRHYCRQHRSVCVVEGAWITRRHATLLLLESHDRFVVEVWWCYDGGGVYNGGGGSGGGGGGGMVMVVWWWWGLQ